MSKEIIKSIVDNTTDIYEQMVLCCVINSPNFYFQYRSVIGYHSENPQMTECKDFTIELDNTIYNVASQYYELLNQTNKTSDIQPCTQNWINNVVTGLIDSQKKPETFKMSLVPRLQAIQKFVCEDIKSTVELGLSYWLEQKRAMRKMNEALYSQQELPGIMKDLQVIQKTSQITEDEPDSFVDACVTDDDDLTLEYMPGPLETLNLATGQGFARGEAVGILAPQGAGKTVFACQHADCYACDSNNVLLITTEQPMKKLFPRFVSMRCNIPFSRINRGVHLDRLLNSEEKKTVTEYQNRISQHLRVKKWDKSLSLAQGLEPIIDQYIDSGFEPDVIIVDWIGGGLGQNRKLDFLRHYYKESADKMADIANAYNAVSMYFAQAHVSARGKEQAVTDQYLNECKSMFDNATWGIGISALENKDKEQKQKESYQTKQFLNPFKTRMSEGFLIEVHRDFGFQRFKDPKAGRKKPDNVQLPNTGNNLSVN